MKSSPRLTGRAGGLSLNDGLMNVATGAGTGKDASTFARWSLGTGVDYACGLITPLEIDAAYKTSWLVRKVHDIIPEEMTRAWRTWSLPADQITKVEAEEKRLNVRAAVQEAARLARLRGGAALVLGLPGYPDTAAPATIGPGALKYILPLSREELQFSELDWNPRSNNFGQPKRFMLSVRNGDQVEIHPSRVIAFPGLPSPGGPADDDISRFWGRPLMESMDDALKNATAGQNGIAGLIAEAKVDVISIPGLTDMVSTGPGEALLANRLRVAQLMRSMFQAIVLDGGTGAEGSGEEWETRQITWSGLPAVGTFLLQCAAAAADIPFTRLFNAPPEGMDATGEGDDENFKTMIRGKQNTELRPRLERLDFYLLPSAGVRPDTEATFTFSPLDTPTPEEQAEADNKTADTFSKLKTTGLIQQDALAATLVATLADRPTFPGLAEAVDASTEPLPATMEAEMALGMNEAKVKSLNTPQGPVKTAKRVKAKDGVTLADAEPRPLYVSRRVLNPQELLNHFRAQGVEGLEAAGDLHVTIAYSRQPVDWMKVPATWSDDDAGRIRIAPGGPRVLEVFGPERDTLVQSFASDALRWRHETILDAGASWDWPDYQPHITIAKVAPDFDASKVRPYTGRIVLGPEIFEEVV